MKFLALIGPEASEEKTYEHCGQRQLWRTTEHEYIISSPCEPNGSGELKMVTTIDSQCKL